VERQHRVHPIHRAVLDHARSAADPLLVPDLFCRLEEKAHGALERFLRQQRRHPQCHGGVGIVPAGVHHAGDLRGVGNLVGLVDGQRIHVGPDGDDGMSLPQLRHDAGAPHAGAHPIAQRIHHLCDAGRGARLLETKLGARVELSPPGDQLIFYLVRALVQRCLCHVQFSSSSNEADFPKAEAGCWPL